MRIYKLLIILLLCFTTLSLASAVRSETLVAISVCTMRKDRVYHRLTCRYAEQIRWYSKKNNTSCYMETTPEEAIKKGYRPCRVCCAPIPIVK